MNVSVKHHLIFGFFISFSPCNIMEIYQIECPVWQNRVSEICPFPLFFLGGFSAFYSTGKVSVILCPRCANMATASSSNKYNQLMEREKNRCHAMPFSFGSENSQESPFHSSCSAQLLTQVGENGTRLPLSPKIPHGSLALGCALLRLCISKKTGRISPFSR